MVATELSYYPFTYVLSIGPPLRMGELTDITESRIGRGATSSPTS